MKTHGTSPVATVRKPLIVLFNSRSASDRRRLSAWLASHTFSSYEASDPLDAIGLMSDFTTAGLPDVVTIPGSLQDDVSTISEMICSLMSADGDLPVFVYSQESNAGARCLSIEEIGERLMLQGGRGEN